MMIATVKRRARLGDSVQITSCITTAGDSGSPAAPGVSLKIKHENGNLEEIDAAAIQEVSLGHYVAAYRPAQSGRHLAIWEASGDHAGVATVIFDVDAMDLALLDTPTIREYLGTTSVSDADIFTAHRAERDAQADWCRIDPYTWQLREALLRRIARNLAARRTPTSVVNALGQATSGASSAQLDAEISRLEAPHRKAGFA